MASLFLLCGGLLLVIAGFLAFFAGVNIGGSFAFGEPMINEAEQAKDLAWAKWMAGVGVVLIVVGIGLPYLPDTPLIRF